MSAAIVQSQFFLDNGADVVTDAPFAIVFREKVQTAFRIEIRALSHLD
jgi:hypothetical protein